MTASEAALLIFQTFVVLSVLLLAGMFLRAKIRLFQELYLPACVIGGFLGLIIGPNVLGWISFNEDMMGVASNIPGILIIPIIASLPLCAAPITRSMLIKQKDILVVALLIGFTISLQFAVGLFVNSGSSFFGIQTYQTLGLELPLGFSGGHGLAGSLTETLQSMAVPYWETAQGMAVTTATVGLLGGILIGIFLINVAVRKGYTTLIKPGYKGVQSEFKKGYYSNENEQPSLGKQTTVSNSIETMTLHVTILLLASGGGYLLGFALNFLNWSFLEAMSTWFYALIAMFIIWYFIRRFKIDHLFNEKVKNGVVGLISDFLIVAAIMSIPIQVVFSYWIPLVIMCVLGLIITPTVIWFISKMFLQNNWFEKGMGVLGASTGVFITGLLLLKMVDPDLESNALHDYGLGYTMINFIAIPFIAFMIPFTVSQGALVAAFLSLAVTIVYFILILTIGRKPRNI